jgi:hypothetical protein
MGFLKIRSPEALGQGKSVAIVNVLTGIQSLEGSAVGFGWWGVVGLVGLVGLVEVLVLTAGLPVESITTRSSEYNRQSVAPWNSGPLVGGEKGALALGSGFPGEGP